MRAQLVWLHRYVGLVMAAFLVIAGLTGAVLAWYPDLDRAVNRHMMQVDAPPGAVRIDPLVLRERVQARYPDALANCVALRPLHDHAQVFYLSKRPGQPAPAVNEVYVDPYTGSVLGARKWGDLSEGLVNLMPFIYRLHYTLALDTIGTWTFGIVAVLWTLDCFVGAWLTFPARRQGPGQSRLAPRLWMQRWWPAWKVRWSAGTHKRNVDLHRAGGLWPWAMLLVLAWSGVALNLNEEVYRPFMSRAFAMQPQMAAMAPVGADRPAEPPLGWSASLAAARSVTATVAAREGVVVINEDRISYDPKRGLVRMVVRTDRDINERYGQTSIYLDAHTGRLAGTYFPTGQAAGDTLTSWITTLHMASMWGVPFRLLITIIGVAVAMLSVTGVLIWWKKRRARVAARRGAHGAHGMGRQVRQVARADRLP